MADVSYVLEGWSSTFILKLGGLHLGEIKVDSEGDFWWKCYGTKQEEEFLQGSDHNIQDAADHILGDAGYEDCPVIDKIINPKKLKV
jgi:hypothetical protein